MSGIRTGSRLEQLEALRRRLDHEITVERRRAIIAGELVIYPTPTLAGSTTIKKRASDRRTAARLDQLGVTPRQVKEWAVHVGLLDHFPNGRVALALVEQYAQAHPTPPGGNAPETLAGDSVLSMRRGAAPPGGHEAGP